MAAAQADSEPPPPALVPFDPTSAEDLPTLAEPEREALLAKMRDWNYGEGGVFQRDAELGGHALYHTTAEGIRHFDLCNKLSIEPAKLHRWILAVERCMQPDRLVPYHNAVHVCDVVHAAWWFLAEGQLAQLLTPRATLAVLLAACAHDTGHPGRIARGTTAGEVVVVANAQAPYSDTALAGLNNNWWADRELGRVYHGRSPLENFHIRQALELMRHPDSNPLDGLGTDGDAVRKYMIDAILDTDLVYHNRCCEQFKQKLDRGPPLYCWILQDMICRC
eukprot:SAG25_NODE_346_length_9382_cov_25.918669_7_plen_278_part_00